jgi:glycosidase
MKWKEDEQDRVLLEANRKLAGLRNQYPALQTGSYHELYLGEGIFSFVRSSPTEQILACLNMSQDSRCIKVPHEWESGWEPIYAVNAGLSGLSHLELPQQGVRIFKRSC